jgi:Double zinc ribbon
MPAALFGITNDALNLVVNLVILFLVVLWLALVAWTYFDARRRLQDGFLVLCATVCSLIFPFVGTIVYSILRPPEFLADQRERELEIRASELRVRQLEEQSCPNCEHPIERTFLRCPNCRARIKDPCESCGKPIDPRWTICPYCETPTRAAAASPQRRPSSRPPAEGAPAKKARTGSSRSASRPSRAKRPASRTSTAEQRPVKERSKKAPVRRSTSKKPSGRRSEPGDGTAPAS